MDIGKAHRTVIRHQSETHRTDSTFIRQWLDLLLEMRSMKELRAGPSSIIGRFCIIGSRPTLIGNSPNINWLIGVWLDTNQWVAGRRPGHFLKSKIESPAETANYQLTTTHSWRRDLLRGGAQWARMQPKGVKSHFPNFYFLTFFGKFVQADTLVYYEPKSISSEIYS